MCGRFYVDDDTAKEIERTIRKVDEQLKRQQRTGDIYPTQTAAVISADQKEMAVTEKRWGFPGFGSTRILINARAETALTKRMFQDSLLRRRMIIPASGFYEWSPEKEKVIFTPKGEPGQKAAVLYMAGFYQKFDGEDRFVILTTDANESVKPVHHRMPLVLEPQELEDWLWNDSRLEQLLYKKPGALEGRVAFEQQRLLL